MLWPKKLIVKNSEFKNNSRTSMRKGIFSNTVPVLYHNKIQNTSRNSRIGLPESLTNTFSSNLMTANLSVSPIYGGRKTWRKSLDQPKELWKYLSLNLIVIIKRFQRSFCVQFLCWPWPGHIIWNANSTNSCSDGLR